MVAYTDQGELWLLDGREPNADAKPKQLTDPGLAELIGWSADGAWLAYKHTGEGEDALTYLWAARADGSETKQVDTEPIYDDPLWSGKA